MMAYIFQSQEECITKIHASNSKIKEPLTSKIPSGQMAITFQLKYISVFSDNMRSAVAELN